RPSRGLMFRNTLRSSPGLPGRGVAAEPQPREPRSFCQTLPGVAGGTPATYLRLSVGTASCAARGERECLTAFWEVRTGRDRARDGGPDCHVRPGRTCPTGPG